MLQPRAIIFIGTVGSGKSTHMRLLYSKLKQKRLRTKMSALKSNELLASILVILLTKIVASKRKDVFPIRALIEERPTLFRKILRLWLALDIISITLKFLISIYLPLRLGYIVLVEEYIPATISDYIYLSRFIKFPLKMNSFTINYLLRLMNLCWPAQIIFLDAKDDELKKRWKLRKSFDEKEDYLQMQRTLLLQISKKLSSLNFIYINTETKALEETQILIISQLLV
jgi:thymidylate kinase